MSSPDRTPTPGAAVTSERTGEIQSAARSYVQQLIASGRLVREDGKWWSSAPYFAPAAKVSTDEEYRVYDHACRDALERAAKDPPPELTCPPDGCGAYECHENGCRRENGRPTTPGEGADLGSAEVAGAAQALDHFLYIVLRQLETDPPEVFPFHSLADAESFYDRAQTQWTGVYLCRILRAADRPLDQQPAAPAAPPVARPDREGLGRLAWATKNGMPEGGWDLLTEHGRECWCRAAEAVARAVGAAGQGAEPPGLKERVAALEAVLGELRRAIRWDWREAMDLVHDALGIPRLDRYALAAPPATPPEGAGAGEGATRGLASPVELRTALAHYGKHADYCAAAKWAAEGGPTARASARHDACDCGLSSMIDGGPAVPMVAALVGCLGLGTETPAGRAPSPPAAPAEEGQS